MRPIRLRSSHRHRSLRVSHRQRSQQWTPPTKDVDLIFESDLMPKSRKKRKRKK